MLSPMLGTAVVLLTLLLCVGTPGSAQDIQDKTVRVVYLVSGDRSERTDYREAVAHAIRELQVWYGQQLGGPTFRLHDPVVEVARSAQPAAWFSSHPDGDNRDDWGYNNGLAEVNRLLGARLNDLHYIWVIYSDGPGDKGRGGSGVCVLPEDDLLGLVGRHPTQKKTERWVGGLGHELGHAFGLLHPADTKKNAEALMWAGFYDQFPGRAYLTAEDKQILLRSPFFFDTAGQPVFRPPAFAETYSYPGGFFARIADTVPPRWQEGKTDSAETYSFDEVRRDAQAITLKDPGRGFIIVLPIAGGQSRLSMDDGVTFRPFYTVQKE
jgi:hypothetical protein